MSGHLTSNSNNILQISETVLHIYFTESPLSVVTVDVCVEW